MATEVEVYKLPTCDVCWFEEGKPGVEAHYDVKTIHGPWANVCEKHFASHAIGGLGTGRGQRLIVKKEGEG